MCTDSNCSVWHVKELLLSTTISKALLYILHPVLAGLAMSRWSGVRTMQGLYSLPSTVCTSVCTFHSRDWKVNYFVLVCVLKFKVYLETVRNGVKACFLDLIDYTHRLLGCQVVFTIVTTATVTTVTITTVTTATVTSVTITIWFLSFVTIWVEFYHNLSFWVLS